MKSIYLVISLMLILCMVSGCQTLGIQKAKGPEGVYLTKASTPMGERDFTIAINADGTGYIEGTTGKMEFSDAQIDGSNFNIPVTANTPMGEMKLLFKGTVEGDNISGTVGSQMGESPFSGKRK